MYFWHIWSSNCGQCTQGVPRPSLRLSGQNSLMWPLTVPDSEQTSPSPWWQAPAQDTQSHGTACSPHTLQEEQSHITPRSLIKQGHRKKLDSGNEDTLLHCYNVACIFINMRDYSCILTNKLLWCLPCHSDTLEMMHKIPTLVLHDFIH